mmetsp:Transcript_32409/g.61023  ORF Transcript_32409/g.61023 Transcript_32409/m.61023 type:complete len:482 (-) Transcript_32409:20-1465(-)
MTSFEVEPAEPSPAPRRTRASIIGSNTRMRSLYRASVCAVAARQDGAFAEALKAEAEEFGEQTVAKITSFEAIANFVIGSIGAGIVVLPKTMALNGWGLALALIVVSALVTFETGCLTLACCDLAELATGARAGSVTNYEQIAGAAFGTAGTTVLAVVKNGYAIGSLIVYTVLMVEGFHFFLGELGASEAVVRWCLVTPLVVLLSMIVNLKQLARVAPVGTVAVFSQCAAICIGSLFMSVTVSAPAVPGGSLRPTWQAVYADVFQIGSAISVFVFGFDGIVNLPSIRGQMGNPAELPGALRIGFVVVVCCCIVVMCCGYYGFGSWATSNVIQGMGIFCGDSCLFSNIASLGVTTNLLISYPLIFFTVISFLESVMKGSLADPLSKENVAIRTAMALGMLLTGIMLNDPKAVINLVSSVFGSCLSIFFPLALFYKLRQQARNRGHAVDDIPPVRLVAHGGVVLVGATAMIFGFLDALAAFTK